MAEGNSGKRDAAMINVVPGKSEVEMTAVLDRKEPSAATIARAERHKYFMSIAMAVRNRANCRGNRVGVVIARDNRIISTGYNGTPENMLNCLDGGCLRCLNRDKQYKSGEAYDLCICVHAEQNAILAAARFGIAIQNSIVYTTLRPCFGCAKEMLQAQIDKIFYLHEWSPVPPPDRVTDVMHQKEYDKLLLRFPGGVHKLQMDDPDVAWAVSKKAPATSLADEHGTQDQ
jgi:dCMP deaminase